MMDSGIVSWSSPSNIALVKYWGKHGIQLPANPSISFSLNECRTETSLEYKKGSGKLEFYFHGESKPEFLPKIETFLKRIEHLFPFLKEYDLKINSQNSFPHSSGIASSASAMSALALCVGQMEEDLFGTEMDLRKVSNAARLGSGSACRSVYGGYSLWGEIDGEFFSGGSDEYAIPIPEVNMGFMSLQDTILLIDKGVKQVSSTVGHGLMNGHLFAQQRFEQAKGNILSLANVLRWAGDFGGGQGDFNALADIIESEALSLHAMMMTSKTPYVLMRPGTVEVISRIMNRRKSGEPVSFTLDAGANVHMIYPEKYVEKALEFINEELVDFCADGAYICDRVGTGPMKMVQER